MRGLRYVIKHCPELIYSYSKCTPSLISYSAHCVLYRGQLELDVWTMLREFIEDSFQFAMCLNWHVSCGKAPQMLISDFEPTPNIALANCERSHCQF